MGKFSVGELSVGWIVRGRIVLPSYTTSLTRSINVLGLNSVLGRIPPKVDDLSRLRCRHHNALLSYRKSIHPKVTDTYRMCHICTHTIHHIMEECPSLYSLRNTHPLSVRIISGIAWDPLLPSSGMLVCSVQNRLREIQLVRCQFYQGVMRKNE